MWTWLSTVPGSVVESPTHRDGCQPVLGEWPWLNKCEEWITVDKLDFISALVAPNWLQREPNLVKLFFRSWLVRTTGWQWAGLGNPGSGQWMCWYGKETADKGSSNFAGAAGNGTCRGLGKRTSYLWVAWHCRFKCSFTSKTKEAATVWISPGKAVLMPCWSILLLLTYVKCFSSSLVLLTIAIRFMTVLLK